MEPKRLREMEAGDTLLLAREIMERTNVSQVYVKVDDRTVRHYESGEESPALPEELVYPFHPEYAAKR